MGTGWAALDAMVSPSALLPVAGHTLLFVNTALLQMPLSIGTVLTLQAFWFESFKVTLKVFRRPLGSTHS